jgi:hypothetical protein
MGMASQYNSARKIPMDVSKTATLLLLLLLLLLLVPVGTDDAMMKKG